MFNSLKDVEDAAYLMLEEHNLVKKVRIKWSNRLTACWGQFIYFDENDKVTYIELSRKLIELNLDNSILIFETLRHEIAHALDYYIRGFTNHDKHFKQVAFSIGSDGNAKTGKFLRYRDIKKRKKK